MQITKAIDALEVTTFKGRVRKYQINNAEKDSLFKEANELAGFERQPKRFCSDYVGTFKIRIRYNSQVLKEVSFTSICDWRGLNTNTTQIDLLLNKIFEVH